MLKEESTYKSRIAKNAVYLYARKGFSILLGLYTSRLVLERLGVDDFGLYGVVGSVVLLFNSLRYIFSDSVQRYINIATGADDNVRINEIFSIGVNIHAALSLLFILVVEICGYFILPHLQTGEAPVWVVQIIFQVSLFSAVLTLMTVPYDALIIANERFKAYALFSMMDVVLRLVLAYCLIFFADWRVVWYAVFILVIQWIVRIANVVYCKQKFKDNASYKFVKNKKLTIEIARFAGWNFIGNIGYWVTMSGVDMILNHFGGLAINAARNIANQVFTNFTQFVGDLNTSFRPRSMMLYGNGERGKYYELMFLNTKMNFFICGCLCFIFTLYTPEILGIWLGDVPSYTTVFTRYILLYALVRALRGPVDIYYKTIGQLKIYQIVEFIITILNFPLGIIALQKGCPLYTVFAIMAVLEVVNYMTIVSIASHKYGFAGNIFFHAVGTRVLSGVMSGAILYLCCLYLKEYTYTTIAHFGLLVPSVIVVIVTEFYILFNRSERVQFISFVSKFVRRG